MNQDDTTGFIQVECGCAPMGVKQDGTVVATGADYQGQLNTAGWMLK